MPNITDELSIEANSVDPEQTAPLRNSLILVQTMCHRGFSNISEGTFVAIGALRVNMREYFFFFMNISIVIQGF